MGRKVKDVEAELAQLGLEVETQESESDRPKGEVIAVEEGTFVAGDTVTVTSSDGPGEGNDEGGD